VSARQRPGPSDHALRNYYDESLHAATVANRSKHCQVERRNTRLEAWNATVSGRDIRARQRGNDQGVKPLLEPPPDPVPKPVRMTALVLALYASAVHLALADSRYKDAAYVGALFVVTAMGLAIGASIAASGRRWGRPMAWAGWCVGVVCAVAMFVGFFLARTVGLPDYHRTDWPVFQLFALGAEAAYVVLFTRAAARLREPEPATR